MIHVQLFRVSHRNFKDQFRWAGLDVAVLTGTVVKRMWVIRVGVMPIACSITGVSTKSEPGDYAGVWWRGICPVYRTFHERHPGPETRQRLLHSCLFLGNWPERIRTKIIQQLKSLSSQTKYIYLTATCVCTTSHLQRNYWAIVGIKQIITLVSRLSLSSNPTHWFSVVAYGTFWSEIRWIGTPSR